MEAYFHKTVEMPFTVAVEKVKSALQNEGFGVITQIDMKETLQKKIGVDFRNYVILGACNPGFAFQALREDAQAGLLLPCNVVVQQTDVDTIEVSVVNPEQLMAHSTHPQLQVLAAEVRIALTRALAAV